MKIVMYKLRAGRADRFGRPDVGQVQVWDESDEVLKTTTTTDGGVPRGDYVQRTQGKFLGMLEFASSITRKESKAIFKELAKHFGESSDKVKKTYIPN